MKWYAVPAYKGAEGFIGQPHVVNARGELVANCEALDEAEQIAGDHNALLRPLPDTAPLVERNGTG